MSRGKGKSSFTAWATLRGVDDLSRPWTAAVRKAERQTGRSFSKMERAAMRTDRGFRKAARSARSIGRGMKKGAAGSFGPAIGGLKSAGVVAAGAAVGVGMAVDRFAEYETSLARIGNLFDDSVDVVDLLDGSVKRLSVSLGQDQLEVVAGAYQAFSGGVTASKESLDSFMLAAGEAAVAGNSTLADSVGMLTSVINAYGEAVYSADQITDKMFLTEAKGVTTFAELSAEIGTVVSQAQALGVGLDDLLGPLAAITRAGVSTGEAVTQESSLLSGIQDPRERRKTFQELGLPTGAGAVTEVGGLDVYIAKIREAIKSGKTVKRHGRKVGGADLIPALFGRKEAQKLLFRLTGDQGFTDMVTSTDAIRNSEGTRRAKYQNVSKRSGHKIHQLEQGAKLLFQAVGEGVSRGSGIGDLEDIPDRMMVAEKKVSAASEAFAKGFADSFTALNDGADFDWEGFAAVAGSSLASIGTAAGTLATALATVVNTYSEMYQLAKKVAAELEADSTVTEAAAAKHGAGVREAHFGWYGGRDAAGAMEDLGPDVVRQIDNAEVNRIQADRERKKRNATAGRAAAWAGDAPESPWAPAAAIGFSPAPADVSGRIEVAVTVTGGTAEAVVTQKPAGRVKLQADTGRRGVGR